jgi:hypothetical protein
MPPKEELFRRFENTVNVFDGEEEVVLEWCGGTVYFWFRPFGAPIEMLWFGSFTTSWDSYGASADRIRQHGEGAVKILWSRRLFFRVVWLSEKLDAPEKSWIALQPKRVGLVLDGEGRYGNWNTAAFQTLSLEQVQQGPFSVLEDVIKCSMKADLEEWRELIQWAQLDDEARFWSLVSWERGSPQEWMALMHALLQLWVRSEGLNREVWRVSSFGREIPPFPVPLRTNQYGLKQTINELIVLPQQYFNAMVHFSRSRTNIRGAFICPLLTPVLKVEQPTNHELMQALDVWRDFGRRSNQLARVEELLRELLG